MKHFAAARLLVCILAVLALSACGEPSSSHSSSSESPTVSATVAPPSATAAADNGLVAAAHAKCNVGAKILHYLATGDNQGDPQLDILYARDVGTSLPQARSIASQNIQRCDANLFQQEAQQASAAASSAAKASQAAAEAQASAQAAQDKAARLAIEQGSCTAAGGNLRVGGVFTNDLCVSAPQSKSGAGTSCSAAYIEFQSDGTLSSKDISDLKATYPGCFV